MEQKFVVGIDIGGTNTVIGIVDAHGTVLVSTSMPTQEHERFEDYISEIHRRTTALAEAVGVTGRIAGIGVGAPNASYYSGCIENASNLRWSGSLPLCKLLSEKFGLPAACTNDANAAAIGEMTYGAARGMKNFIMITLGTGVGSGIVVNGQILYGHDGFAGELGHTTSKAVNGRLCTCGRTGCLECYCSASGVSRTAREWLEIRSDDSMLRNLPIDSITSKDVYTAAINGDRLACEIFEYTGTILGTAFAEFITFSAPEAIILFGGLSKSGNLLLDPIKKAMEENVLFLWKNKVKVLLSGLKDADAAVLGASALGWDSSRRNNHQISDSYETYHTTRL